MDDSPSLSELNLARIVIDRASAVFLMEELIIAGVERFSMFPDLDRVADHVRWKAQSKSPIE